MVCVQIPTEIFITHFVALKLWSVSEYSGMLHCG